MDDVIRPLKDSQLAPSARKNLKKVRDALKDMTDEVIPVEKGIVERVEAAQAYEHPEPEWNDDESVVPEETPHRQFTRDFTGEGLSGKTDLSEEQSVLLTQFRILQADYDARFPEFKLANFPDWFEKYRLSVERRSRKEIVDTSRGQMPISPPLTESHNPLGKF